MVLAKLEENNLPSTENMMGLSTDYNSKQAILEEAFAFYKKTFWIALPYSMIASLCIFTPALLDLLIPHKIVKLEGLWETLTCWLLGLIVLTALIFRLYCICYQIPNNFLKSIQHALFKIIPLLLLFILYALIVLSSTMLLIIPGVILAVSLMFSFTLLITTNQKVLQTLISSHRLVWGHWWHTLFVFCIPILIGFVLSLSAFVLLVNFSLTMTALLVNALIQGIFTPFVFLAALVLLHDLNSRLRLPPRW